MPKQCLFYALLPMVPNFRPVIPPFRAGGNSVFSRHSWTPPLAGEAKKAIFQRSQKERENWYEREHL